MRDRWVIAIGLSVFCAYVWLGAAEQAQYVKIQPPSSVAPLSIYLTPDAPDGAQVCAATSNWVSCRTVAEFRQWVQEHPQQMRK